MVDSPEQSQKKSPGLSQKINSKVVSKLAFHPPKKSYQFIENTSSFVESDKEENNYGQIAKIAENHENNNKAQVNTNQFVNSNVNAENSTIVGRRQQRKQRKGFGARLGDSIKRIRKNVQSIKNKDLNQNLLNISQAKKNEINIPKYSNYRIKFTPEGLQELGSDSAVVEDNQDRIIADYVYISDSTDLSPNSIQNRLASVYIKYSNNRQIHLTRKNSKFVILYSHGNGTDIGQLLPFLLLLSNKMETDIFTYDYNGYGCSSGKSCSEAKLYLNIRKAYTHLREKYGYESEDIILYGQSIGTVPTIELAAESKQKFASIVLHSPMLSGKQSLAITNALSSILTCFNPFPNNERIVNVTNSKILIIHGENDKIIPKSHSEKLLQIIENTQERNFTSIDYDHRIIIVSDKGHNDICWEEDREYRDGLTLLITGLEKKRSDWAKKTCENS